MFGGSDGKLGGSNPKGILKPDTAQDASTQRPAAAAAADIDAFEPAPKKSVEFQEGTRFSPSKIAGEVRRKSKKGAQELENRVIAYKLDEKGVLVSYNIAPKTDRRAPTAAVPKSEPLKKIDMEEVKLDASSRKAELTAYAHSVESLLERLRNLKAQGLSSHKDVKV